MKVLTLSAQKIVDVPEKVALCLGCFDGVHLGHQELIKTALRKSDFPVAVLTFSRSLGLYLHDGKSQQVLTSLDDRLRIFQKLRVAYVFVIEPDAAFLALSPTDFIKDVLSRLPVGAIYVGSDYRFGLGAKGTLDLLRNFFPVTVVPLLKRSGEKISSRTIASFLKEGRIEDVTSSLGRPYEIYGKVVRGQGLGHRLGFPTANIAPLADYVLPREGVYETLIYLNGVPYRSLTNVGRHPSVNELSSPSIEVHIPSYQEELYGRLVYLVFLSFVRPERKFDDPSSLIAQIKRDLVRIGLASEAEKKDRQG